MIAAFQKDDALLKDILSAEDGEKLFHLWWLGQSGFLLKWNGNFLLFDPYLSDSLTAKYAGTDKPHARMSERVIDPKRLDFVKVVTSSHNHTDHLDKETLCAIAEAAGGIALVLPVANIGFAKERLGDAPIEYLGMDDDEGRFHGVWEIEGVAAAHNEVEKDEQGRCRFMGFDIGFGEFNVYHSGDTLWHEGLVPELCESSPDVALLPINGNKPERPRGGEPERGGGRGPRQGHQRRPRGPVPLSHVRVQHRGTGRVRLGLRAPRAGVPRAAGWGAIDGARVSGSG